jgi:hypothetical protein
MSHSYLQIYFNFFFWIWDAFNKIKVDEYVPFERRSVASFSLYLCHESALQK